MGGWGDGGVLTYFWYSGLLQAKPNKMDIQNPKKTNKMIEIGESQARTMLAVLYLKKTGSYFNSFGKKYRTQFRNRYVCLTNISFRQTFFANTLFSLSNLSLKSFFGLVIFSKIFFVSRWMQCFNGTRFTQWLGENSLFYEHSLQISCLLVYIFEHVIYI